MQLPIGPKMPEYPWPNGKRITTPTNHKTLEEATKTALKELEATQAELETTQAELEATATNVETTTTLEVV